MKRDQDIAARMFVISFLVLFFELVCIRWFPANIRHLGYFTNYILLASFLGIGIGILWGKKGVNLLRFFTPALVPVLLLASFFHFQIRIPMDEVIYFQSTVSLTPFEPFYMIPVIFFFVALLFTLLSSPMGKLFEEMPALHAYKANILGSLGGILLFTLLSYFRFPPFIWMLPFFTLLFIFFPEKKPAIYGHAALALIAIIILFASGRSSIWSFYYKITYQPMDNGGYDVWVNNTGHQMLIPSKYVDAEPMYGEIYRHYSTDCLKDMLILGAGGGRDTAYNLQKGVESIDAVEIDPVLMQFGKALHPEMPYLNPKVRLFNEDARTFMKRQQKKYDCIIFALPDSLVLSSSYSSLRLESYLFTLEAFEEAKRLLKPEGILVLYNYYRKPWLLNKLATMLDVSFGYPPAAFIYSHCMACFITGPGSSKLKTSCLFDKFVPATDDWPFLYLKKPSFPGIYLKMILSIIVITLIFYFLSPRPKTDSFNIAFFFLGAAFLLLETKCIVNFSLLFGSTWIVNSVVFFVILSLVLVAISITSRYTMKNSAILYALLLVTILLNYLIPMKVFLGLPPIFQYIAAPIFYLTPIFFANLVFTYHFNDSSEASTPFASNMLGAIIGGISEYSAMLTGYNNLLLAVFAFYLVAIFFFKRKW